MVRFQGALDGAYACYASYGHGDGFQQGDVVLDQKMKQSGATETAGNKAGKKDFRVLRDFAPKALPG